MKGEGREGVGWGQCLKRTVSLRFQKQWWPRCWTVGQSPRALPSQPPWPPLAKLVTAVDIPHHDAPYLRLVSTP